MDTPYGYNTSLLRDSGYSVTGTGAEVESSTGPFTIFDDSLHGRLGQSLHAHSPVTGVRANEHRSCHLGTHLMRLSLAYSGAVVAQAQALEQRLSLALAHF